MSEEKIDGKKNSGLSTKQKWLIGGGITSLICPPIGFGIVGGTLNHFRSQKDDSVPYSLLGAILGIMLSASSTLPYHIKENSINIYNENDAIVSTKERPAPLSVFFPFALYTGNETLKDYVTFETFTINISNSTGSCGLHYSPRKNRVWKPDISIEDGALKLTPDFYSRDHSKGLKEEYSMSVEGGEFNLEDLKGLERNLIGEMNQVARENCEDKFNALLKNPDFKPVYQRLINNF